MLLCIVLAAPRALAQQMPALPTGVRIVLATCDRIVNRAALLEQLRIELLSTGVVDIEVVDPDTGNASEVQKADRIVVLSHGRIAEIGSHAELLAKNGVYANLYHLQFEKQEH